MKMITIDELHEGMICNQTICDNRGMILIARGATITNAYIQGLKKFRISEIPVNDEAEEAPTTTSNSTDKLVTQQCALAVSGLLIDIDQYRTIKIKKNASKIEQVIYSVLERPDFQKFLEIEAQNEFLYKHSLRTTILALSMGIIKDYNFINLEYLAMSGLIHDCGMGKEFQEENDDHPLLGFIKIRNDPNMDMIIALACLQHHEHYNGKGFPLKLRNMQIIEFARLIGIADYYDRLVMKNISPRQAVFKIIASSGTLFDSTTVNLFTNTMH